MDCMVCRSVMGFFFSKEFDTFGLGKVDYWKCPTCGFVASRTHLEMTEDRWAELNDDFHSLTHHADGNPYNRNQRYFNQSLMLHLLQKQGLIKKQGWLDWGCGIGAVSRLLQDFFDLRLLSYDKFFRPEFNPAAEPDLKARGHELVLCTAVLEHLRDRATLDEIERLVSPSGAFAIHTLVPESVPQDPDWMYLLPVHCAFHTNRSMQILMDEWGYRCSVYNEFAKLWVLFHADPNEIEPRVLALNAELGWSYLHFKRGFTDFWK